MDDLGTGDTIDDFEILGVLARSGMGSAYKARQRSNGKIVLLKVPHLHFESDVVFYSRFQREERIGQRLSHRAIAKVFECPDKSRPYIVMEYVDGPSLWQTMKTTDRLPVERVLDLGRQLCEALEYMHSEGVVHRDLKPENIVVDREGRPHIIDFGVALDLGARRITWGPLSSRIGTPEYMAPEQIRGKRGDARTDIYALGIILYELLSGASPFEAAGTAALFHAKKSQSPRPLVDAAPAIDRSVAAAVMRAIAHNPAQRYSSAAEMLVVLRDPSRLDAVASTGRLERGSPHPILQRALVWLGMACFLVLCFAWLVARAR